MFILIFKFLLIIATIEIFIYSLFKYLKKDFQWLIDKSDENPEFSKDLIYKYNKKIFEKNLGWDNKKNKKNTEIVIKDKKIKFEYNFDKEGSRLTGNNYKNHKITFFGDSYAFCRCSQDDQTIQHYLENITKFKITNFGVGNYGLDQVFLKIKKKKKEILNTKNVIIIFVPETISRIHSYWKHFLEFGNILGFKPKFELKNKKIVLYKKHISKINKNKINQKINLLKKKDIFFEKKFNKNKFKFPYTLSFFKNTKKNLLIFYFLILKFFLNNKIFKEKAFSVIVKYNLLEAQSLYADENYNILLKKIIKEINQYLLKEKKNVFFFVIPQLFDLKINQKNINSTKFFNSISKNSKIKMFDLTNVMLKIKNIENYYFDDFYGGHLNNKGNKLISSLIYNKIKNFL